MAKIAAHMKLMISGQIITPKIVLESGAIGYTVVTQHMMFQSKPDWFQQISLGNMDLQADVENVYFNACWTNACCSQECNNSISEHIEANWQKFFTSHIMPEPIEGF
jgi:hypothetical protein